MVVTMRWICNLTSVLAVVVLLDTSSPASDQIPGAEQASPIAIVDGIVHTISGETLERATVLFSEGRITHVGRVVELPEGVERIDAAGKHVYPGLIEAKSNIGLVEINSIRATIDSREIGSNNANVRAASAFNSDSELIPVTRANGILMAVAAPDGGMISGQSSLMLLDGWTRDDMTLKPVVGMHVDWPSTQKGLNELEELIKQTQRYAAVRQADSDKQPLDLRLESLSAVLRGEVPLIIEASKPSSIRAIVAIAKKYSLRVILYGGERAVECADLLKGAKIPVIVSSVYRNPRFRHSAYDEAYTLPKRLHDAGITYCISSGGRFGASGLRNLPYNAATAAAYGLTEEQALRAITLSPAEILGVSDRVGSLQPDRDATLFIADGNILETPTQVERAFIQGREVDLDNRHQQLYRKYSTKYERLRN